MRSTAELPNSSVAAYPDVERVAVTVVIPTLNEREEICGAIASVDWADEVIVVDGGSTDATMGLAAAAGASVIELRGATIGAQRNAGIAAARNHWILALDADERATPELRRSIADLVDAPLNGPRVYKVRSRNWHLGRELRHGPWGRDWKVRVFTRDHRFTEARVHEHVPVTGRVGALSGALVHRPYRDLPHHVTKVAKYARWAAEDLRASGRRVSPLDIVFRPAWRFTRDYLLYAGWRDGGPGFVVAVVSAFSVFCKYAAYLTARPAAHGTTTCSAGATAPRA